MMMAKRVGAIIHNGLINKFECVSRPSTPKLNFAYASKYRGRMRRMN